MDDNAIIDLFFERSERAIAELGAKYGRSSNALAMNILSNAQDAEECVNDAYFGVWNAIPPKKPDPLRAFLLRIVRNLAVKRYHRNTAARRDSRYDVALTELEETLSGVESLEDTLSARELGRLLDAFLDSLKAEDRYIFLRRYWYADAVSAVAESLGMRPNSVSVRLNRIRDRLRDYLIKEGYKI